MTDRPQFQQPVAAAFYPLQSLSIVLEIKILFIATLSLLIVMLIQSFCTELAAGLAGAANFHNAKLNNTIIPILFPSREAPFYSNLILILGWVLDLAILLPAGVGIVRAVAVRLRTGETPASGSILADVRKGCFTVLFSAAGLGIIAAFFAGLVTLLWLTGTIPGVGLILFFLLSPITLVCGLFLLGTLFVIGFSLPSLPAIVFLWQGDAFSVIAQAYSLVLGHPLKLLRAALLNLLETFLAIAVSSVVLCVVLFGIYLLLSREWLLGFRFAIAAQAGFLALFPFGTELIFEPTLYGQIFTLLLRFLSLAVLGYGWATLVAGQMFSFVKLKQKINGLNLLDDK